jgi:hypothetical protein
MDVLTLVHGLGDLRGAYRLWQTRFRAIGVSQRFDMLFVVLGNDDDWKIFATRTDCTEQRQPVRPGFKIDQHEIEIPAHAADNLQRITCTTREVADASALSKYAGNGILQMGIVRKKKHERRLHGSSIRESTNERLAPIAI